MNLLIKSSIAITLLLTPIVSTSHADVHASTTYKYIDKKTAIKYSSIKQNNPNLSVGHTKVIKTGKNGYNIKRYKQTIKDGKVIKSTFVKIIKKVSPVSKVYQKGTKVLPAIPETKFHTDIKNEIYTLNEVSPTSGIQIGTTFSNTGKVFSIHAPFTENYATMAKEPAQQKYDKAVKGDYNFYFETHYDDGLTLTRRIPMNYATVQAFNNNIFFSNKVFNSEIIKLVNAERKKKGISPLKYNAHILNGASIRAMEMANAGKFVEGHLRTDGSGQSFSTAFEPEIAPIITSENAFFEGTSLNPYELVSEKFIAEKAFTWWKNSAVHYKAMMNPNNRSVATSVKLGSKINEKYNRDTLYAAMIFGNK